MFPLQRYNIFISSEFNTLYLSSRVAQMFIYHTQEVLITPFPIFGYPYVIISPISSVPRDKFTKIVYLLFPNSIHKCQTPLDHKFPCLQFPETNKCITFLRFYLLQTSLVHLEVSLYTSSGSGAHF